MSKVKVLQKSETYAEVLHKKLRESVEERLCNMTFTANDAENVEKAIVELQKFAGQWKQANHEYVEKVGVHAEGNEYGMSPIYLSLITQFKGLGGNKELTIIIHPDSINPQMVFQGYAVALVESPTPAGQIPKIKKFYLRKTAVGDATNYLWETALWEKKEDIPVERVKKALVDCLGLRPMFCNIVISKEWDSEEKAWNLKQDRVLCGELKAPIFSSEVRTDDIKTFVGTATEVEPAGERMEYIPVTSYAKERWKGRGKYYPKPGVHRVKIFLGFNGRPAIMKLDIEKALSVEDVIRVEYIPSPLEKSDAIKVEGKVIVGEETYSILDGYIKYNDGKAV